MRRELLLAIAIIVCTCFGCTATVEPSTDLYTAVRRGEVSAIESLVAEGANPNAQDGAGNGPLHLAVELGNSQAVSALLKSGADPSLRNTAGYSVFFLASVIQQDSALTAVLMNAEDNTAEAQPYPMLNFGSMQPPPRDFASPASLVQWNPRFGYRFRASPDWKVYNIQQDGMWQKQSIGVFLLPPIWSELEGQEIENAVSVFAKEEGEVGSLEEAVSVVRLTIPPTAELVGAGEEGAVTFDYDQVDGNLVYRKRTVVRFNEGVMYQIEFTATPGTFELNLPVFSAFADSIQFSAPERQ